MAAPRIAFWGTVVAATTAVMLLISYLTFRTYAMDVATWSMRTADNVEAVRSRGVMLATCMKSGIAYRGALEACIGSSAIPVLGRIAFMIMWPGAGMAALCHLPAAPRA